MTLLASLLKELKDACDKADATRLYTYVTTTRLRSMIRKYEDQKTHDTSDQPGEWQIRGGNVEAIQHDGSQKMTEVIQHWIIDRGGKSMWSMHEGKTYIRLDSPREPNLVGPGWWVVHTADGIFFAVSDSDFHIIYVPREA